MIYGWAPTISSYTNLMLQRVSKVEIRTYFFRREYNAAGHRIKDRAIIDFDAIFLVVQKDKKNYTDVNKIL